MFAWLSAGEAGAALNNDSWLPLGSGINGPVYALVVSGTDVYAGGSFTLAGGVQANCVARWDGLAWHALGSGIGGGPYASVYALASMGGRLYAGGVFTNAGGVLVTNLAEWNGSTWSGLGASMTGYGPCVYALAADGGQLYVGGNFSTINGLQANNVARWSAGGWSVLSSLHPADPAGVNGTVYALAASDQGVYVGGFFSGGVITPCVARWTASGWAGLGSGLNGAVRAFLVSGTSVYAAGDFLNQSGSQDGLRHIAKWNGSVWSALSYWGLNSTGDALALCGTNLIAGGNFTQAGNVTANCIAVWNEPWPWLSIGSGVNGTVRALATDGKRRIFAGGEFTQAGGRDAPHVAQVYLPSRGRFENCSVSATEGFTCTFRDATPGEVYRIELSPSLESVWMELTNFTYAGPTSVKVPPGLWTNRSFLRAVAP